MGNSNSSFRVLRPMFWWLLLVLALFTIRTHQRLMEKTRLRFSVSMQGRPIRADVTFDGKPASNGQKITLGSHELVVTYPKAVPFSTNLFFWYGEHDFRDIDLKRTMGTLNVEVNPPAQTVNIRGPEFQLTLANSSGTNISVPTDDYTVEAKYALFEERKTTAVPINSSATVRIIPQLGSATLETDPSGASVIDVNRRKLGTTPLTLSELPIGVWKLTLERNEYQSVAVSLNVSTGQTNYVQTNLVNQAYATAVWAGKNYFAAGRYADAIGAANEALKIKPDDLTATFLLREATGFSHLARAKANAERSDFPAAIAELHIAWELIPDSIEVKQLLASYAKQGQEELAERKAQEKIKELRSTFSVFMRPVEGAAQFAEHELVTTNGTTAVAAALKKTFSEGKPSFRVMRSEQPRPDIFAMQARQILIFGYRECFIVGEEIRPGETRILFKVVEYDHLPTLNILGGILTARVTQERDANKIAQFQQQIREGAPMVKERIRQALEK